MFVDHVDPATVEALKEMASRPAAGELHLPEDLARLPVIAVVGGSPAAQALLRMCRHPPLRPGQIVPVTEEELRSLREDVLVVALAGEAPEGR